MGFLAVLIVIGIVQASCFSLHPEEIEELDAGFTDQSCLAEVQFVVPRSNRGLGFWETPWPNDLRRKENGLPDFRWFPNRRRNSLTFAFTLLAANTVVDFPTTTPIYFSLSGPIDRSSLPASPADTTSMASSPVLMMALDQEGTELQTVPLEFHWIEDGDDFRPRFMLQVRPVPGFVLKNDTRYAVVITDALKGQQGGPVCSSTDFLALRNVVRDGTPLEDDVLVDALQVHEPLFDAWRRAGGELERIVSGTVFTTGSPMSSVMEARETLLQLDLPTLDDLCVEAGDDLLGEIDTDHQEPFQLYRCTVEVPQFQDGSSPYTHLGSGILRSNVQRMDAVEFHVTVPTGERPLSGFPLVLVGHGTGGDSLSLVRARVSILEESEPQSFVAHLAEEGLATLAFDLPFHGSRRPPVGDPGFLTYNWLNPMAGRDNVLQAALEKMWFVRIIEAMAENPAQVGMGGEAGAPIFDPDKVVLFGHSQGTQGGAVLLALEPKVLGGVLSGAGGGTAQSILTKTEPINILASVASQLQIEPSELDPFHPLLAVVQSFVEPADPLCYARHFFHAPLPGNEAKSVLLFEGLLDDHSPPETAESLAVAGLFPPVAPVAREILGLSLRGLSNPLLPPVTGNVAGGRATAGVVQYATGDHYVVFSNPVATRQTVTFLSTLAKHGKGVIE